MPNPLTDDPTTFSSPVQAPAGGDPRSDTSVGTPFQQLANRTANTKARVDAIVPFSAAGATALPIGVTSGVSTLLTASSLAAMQAIPAAQRTVNMLCCVAEIGLYQYVVAGAPAALANVVVIPTDTIGAWVLVSAGYSLLGQANAVPQLDASARLAAGVPRNGIVAFAKSTPASASLGTGATTVASVTLAGLLVGDVIVMQFGFSGVVPIYTTGNGSTQVQAHVTDPLGGDNAVGARVEGLNPSTASSIQLPFAGLAFFTVVNAGTHTPFWQAWSSDSSGGYNTPCFLAYAMRP